MGNIIVGFIIGLIPLVLGIIKKKVKFGLIGFVTCSLVWIVGTPLFATPVLVIFIWLIFNKINKEKVNFDLINKFILIGIVISILLTISGVVANAIGGYASFYIFLGTPIIIVIIGSYVFWIMNKGSDKYQIRSNSGIVMVSEMISFIACSAIVLVLIHSQVINNMDGVNFFILSMFILGFCLLDILLILLVTLGIKRYKSRKR